MRLLIVEDSGLIRQMTRLAFPVKQNDLQDAANGVEALMHLSRAKQPFDAILLDLQMPDMNGVEFLRALRQRPLHQDTPVVIATSERDDSPLMQEVRRMAVAAIVKKPWKPQGLASVVAQACAGRSPHIDGI
jgi:two-component system, chemotaxis family, chemotaxis protein CheY